jgi:hypothetical protein
MLSLSFDNWKTASSPYINRFLQPDSIIPDPYNPQSWNRYSYVTNRPVNFNDPTGHMMKEDDGGSNDNYCDTHPKACKSKDPDHELSGGSCHDANNNGYSDIVCPDQDNTRELWDLRANADDVTCPAGTPLVECYYAHGSLFMGDETLYISAAEFNDLMLAIYYEVDGRSFIDLTISSIAFDTPFYDLSRSPGPTLPGRACIEGIGCYSRTEINYVAQGIIAAGAGQSREGGLEKVIAWKLASAQHLPSLGTVSMYDVGYNFYHTQNGSMPSPFSPLILIPISVSIQQATNP